MNKMGANFPLMEKTKVNGENAHPIWKRLRKKTSCFQNLETGKVRNIPWNFAKFIIDEKGEIVIYSNPRQSLYKSIDEIENILGIKSGEPSEHRATEVSETPGMSLPS